MIQDENKNSQESGDSAKATVLEALNTHLQRAFPSSIEALWKSILAGTSYIQRFEAKSRERRYVTVREIHPSLSSMDDVSLVARLEFSSPRGGNLVLRDETGSIPVCLRSCDRDPKLLDSIVCIDKFSIISLDDWDDDVIVDENAWLRRGQEKLSTPEKSTRKFYIEVNMEPIILLPWTGPLVPSSSATVKGVLVAFSPIIASNQNTHYWLCELTDGTLLTVNGSGRNRGVRMFMRIGEAYSFHGVQSQLLSFGSNKSVEVLVLDEAHGSITLIPPAMEYNEAEHRHHPVDETQPLVNLFTYQGRVTRRPARDVVELDDLYYVALNNFPKSLLLGLRKGATVLFRNVCQLISRGRVIGFEATFRSDVEVVEMSRSGSGHIRFFSSSVNIACSGLALLHGLDSLARHLAFVQQEVKEKQELMVISGIKEVDGEESIGSHHPVTRFLYQWEVSLEWMMGLTWSPPLGGLCECIASYGKNNDVKEHLMVRIKTSPLTGQLCCFSLDEHICVECLFSPPIILTEVLQSTVRVTDWDVLVERFGEEFSPTRESIEQSLQFNYVKLSKGKCLFHGHISGDDVMGMTRVYLLVKGFEMVHQTETTDRPVSLFDPASSVAFDFNGQGETTFSSATLHQQIDSTAKQSGVAPAKRLKSCEDEYWWTHLKDLTTVRSFSDGFVLSKVISSNIPSSMSVARVVETRKLPLVLFFTVASCQVTSSRSYDVTFRDQRQRRAKGLGVTVTKMLTEQSLRIIARDLFSPVMVDVFLSLEGRLLPPGLLTQPHAVYALSLASVAGGSDSKVYIQADMKSHFNMVHVANKPSHFPGDLLLLPVRSIMYMRPVPIGNGMCVRGSVLFVLWARYSFICGDVSGHDPCTCAITLDRFKLMVLVEMEDGTDQCQVFADGLNAFTLLDIPPTKLKEFCGYATRSLHQIEYRLNAECEATSPQGLFRQFLLAGKKASIPRRCFLVKDKPMKPKEAKGGLFLKPMVSAVSVRRDDVEEDEEDVDLARFAYVKNVDDTKVKTRLPRDKISCKLMEILPEPDLD